MNIQLKFDEHGSVPVIVQDAYTNEVLMLAYANQEAYDKINRNWTNMLLFTVPTTIVGKGRDIWEPTGYSKHPVRLRLGYSSGPGRTDGCRVSYRIAYMLW